MGSQQPYSVEVEDRQFKVSQRAMWAQGTYHESAPRARWEFGQQVVADQLVRVCRPGGTIALTAPAVPAEKAPRVWMLADFPSIAARTRPDMPTQASGPINPEPGRM
jgi:hypothetical protein